MSSPAPFRRRSPPCFPALALAHSLSRPSAYARAASPATHPGPSTPTATPHPTQTSSSEPSVAGTASGTTRSRTARVARVLEWLRTPDVTKSASASLPPDLPHGLASTSSSSRATRSARMSGHRARVTTATSGVAAAGLHGGASSRTVG